MVPSLFLELAIGLFESLEEDIQLMHVGPVGIWGKGKQLYLVLPFLKASSF